MQGNYWSVDEKRHDRKKAVRQTGNTITMNSYLRILHLEDDEEDAEIVQRILIKEMPNCQFLTVDNREDYQQALSTYQPQVIISDNEIPRFSASEALKIIQEQHLLIPFILVTGTVSEEFAAGIIRSGADDYILKDRLSRLPSAIFAAMHKRKTEQEIRDYKYALDQSSIVMVTDPDGNFLYANDNFKRMSKYPESEILGRNVRILNSGYHSKEYFKELWDTVVSGKIWKGEFCNKAKDGSLYWVDATIVPFLDASGKPFQYLSIRNDITNKKMLEQEILDRTVQQQKTITRAILHAQEAERNYLGQELHDNVNQILVSAKLILEYATEEAGEAKDMVVKAMGLVDQSINEIRMLSKRQVTPTKNINLHDLLENLLEGLNSRSSVRTDLSFNFDNQLLDDEIKLNIYRIAQELVNNIIKHAEASQVMLSLEMIDRTIHLVIEDNGKGFNTKSKRAGIGISNLRNRVESFNGQVQIASSPGKGTKVDVDIPF